jgi:hypothetical protein
MSGVAKQSLVEHQASCRQCGASCDARNAQAWASNHVRAHPGHEVRVCLEYEVTDGLPKKSDPAQPPLF